MLYSHLVISYFLIGADSVYISFSHGRCLIYSFVLFAFDAELHKFVFAITVISRYAPLFYSGLGCLVYGVRLCYILR